MNIYKNVYLSIYNQCLSITLSICEFDFHPLQDEHEAIQCDKICQLFWKVVGFLWVLLIPNEKKT